MYSTRDETSASPYVGVRIPRTRDRHVEYGFLSENPEFAERVAKEGIVFIGPPSSTVISMGSKSESKNIMSDRSSLPMFNLIPASPTFVNESCESSKGYQQAYYCRLRHVLISGYPVLIKAIHGGGGKGIRVVLTPSEFMDVLESAKRESLEVFDDANVLVEKYIELPRHVEVQVFVDTFGGVVSLWERYCSVQRRNQKIIEEAATAARAVNYVGAGTVEFIFDNDTQKFYFTEMNARSQAERWAPVTGLITGLDLVEWQLEVAAGSKLFNHPSESLLLDTPSRDLCGES
ncbi:hypothetical protein JVU11DRAFT_4690 [Chiua virens]|nr:hypothetical protein JVU11DRAFT_4690 [Chiua virens]